MKSYRLLHVHFLLFARSLGRGIRQKYCEKNAISGQRGYPFSQRLRHVQTVTLRCHLFPLLCATIDDNGTFPIWLTGEGASAFLKILPLSHFVNNATRLRVFHAVEILPLGGWPRFCVYTAGFRVRRNAIIEISQWKIQIIHNILSLLPCTSKKHKFLILAENPKGVFLKVTPALVIIVI